MSKETRMHEITDINLHSSVTTIETYASEGDDSFAGRTMSIKKRRMSVHFATPLTTIVHIERRSDDENRHMFYDYLDIELFKQDFASEKGMRSCNRRNSLDHLYNEIINRGGIDTPTETLNQSNLDRLRSRVSLTSMKESKSRHFPVQDEIESDDVMFVLHADTVPESCR